MTCSIQSKNVGFVLVLRAREYDFMLVMFRSFGHWQDSVKGLYVCVVSF